MSSWAEELRIQHYRSHEMLDLPLYPINLSDINLIPITYLWVFLSVFPSMTVWAQAFQTNLMTDLLQHTRQDSEAH